MDLLAAGADLDRDVGVGDEVVEPGGVARMSALGGDEHVVLAVLEIGERSGALGVALGADVVEQQRRRSARNAMADDTAGEAIGDGVAADGAAEERPEL